MQFARQEPSRSHLLAKIGILENVLGVTEGLWAAPVCRVVGRGTDRRRRGESSDVRTYASANDQLSGEQRPQGLPQARVYGV